MLRGTLVVGSVIVALAGSASARPLWNSGAGIIVPPVEVDVGGSVPLTGGAAVGASTEVLAGMHWASLAWMPSKFDIGAGYVGSFRPLVPGYRGIARTTQPSREPETFSLSGAYLSVGHRLLEQRRVRAWLSARGELLETKIDGHYQVVTGGAVRLGVELFARNGFAKKGHKTLAIVGGSVAVGFYVEASHRQIPSELGATGVSTGLSLRLPFVLAGAG